MCGINDVRIIQSSEYGGKLMAIYKIYINQYKNPPYIKSTTAFNIKNAVVYMVYDSKFENHFNHWETTKLRLQFFECFYRIIINFE